MPLPIAAIDIGTNSVLLLIVQPQPDRTLTVLADEAHITRIGEGIGTGKLLLPHAMARTLRVLEGYAARCQEHGVPHILAVGTAAFRHVTNAQVFLDEVQRTCGFTLTVIPGEREAELSYLAAARDFGEDCLVCDIGGGSTEFIWRAAPHHPITTVSLPLGAVALHERLCRSDPIGDADYSDTHHAIIAGLRQQLPSTLSASHRPAQLVALAGSATTLAAIHLQLHEYNHWQVHGKVLTLDDVTTILDQLHTRTVAQRKTLPGLEPGRADVILSGTLLLTETMQWLGYNRVTISDRGVRWGLVYERMGG